MKLSAFQPLFEARDILRRELDAALPPGPPEPGKSARRGNGVPKSQAIERATKRTISARDRARKAIMARDRAADTFVAKLLKASVAPLPKVARAASASSASATTSESDPSTEPRKRAPARPRRKPGR